jgi:hypothetical protein
VNSDISSMSSTISGRRGGLRAARSRRSLVEARLTTAAMSSLQRPES